VKDIKKGSGRKSSRPGRVTRQAEWEAFVSRFQKSTADAKSSEKWKMMERIFELP